MITDHSQIDQQNDKGNVKLVFRSLVHGKDIQIEFRMIDEKYIHKMG